MEKEERVTFANRRGQTLVGVLHRSGAAKSFAAAILCHGMESNKDSDKLVLLGRQLAQRDVLALRFDFACAGESSGTFEEITYSGEVEDLEAAFAFMLDQGAKKIAVLGSSMGGTVALLFAAREPRVTALVTVSAPVHPEDFPKRLLSPMEVRRWRDRGHIFYHGQRIGASLLHDLEKTDVPAAATKIVCPVFIIHGGADEVVPVEEAYELHRQLPNSKKLSILRGADHRLSDPALMSQVISDSIDWICRHVL